MEYREDRAADELTAFTSHVLDCEDWVKFIRVLAVKHQVAEDLTYGLQTRTRFGDASNAQLDVYGKHLVTGREGRDDAEYQAYLETRYESFQNAGEPENLIRRLLELTNADSVKWDDTYKHRCNNMIAYFSSLVDLQAVNQDEVIFQMKKAKQGGQGLRIALALEPAFELGEGSDSILDSDNGFNSGQFVEVIVEY